MLDFFTIGINNEGMNVFKAEQSNEDCPKFGSSMQLYDVASQTERGIDMPKVVHEKHQTGEGGMSLQCLTNKLGKSFPAKKDDRGNEISL